MNPSNKALEGGEPGPLETQMIRKFREALAAMTDEEFQASWQDIKRENEGCDSPTAKEFIASFPRSIARSGES